ncbi:hypothetical protein P4284_23120 [Bacillus swezeyi]|uniref:hypothetical protein n=1 Tax=Bacillus swezeyi TaxID=1925020 RepID=UPI002E1E4DA7|nr:hypothetical protein [Bacillus swezeyi]MED2979548.1 hypothetical protein [Bacillus swezeyi]
MSGKEYLILTTRHKDMFFGGSVHLFWCTGSRGCSAILQRAGLYTKEEAFQIGKHSDGEDIPVHFSKFRYDRDFFETDELFIQMPVLYSISKESKKLISEWREREAAE